MKSTQQIYYRCNLHKSFETVQTTFMLTLDDNESPMDRYVNRAMDSIDCEAYRRFLLLIKGIAFSIDIVANPEYNLPSNYQSPTSV